MFMEVDEAQGGGRALDWAFKAGTPGGQKSAQGRRRGQDQRNHECDGDERLEVAETYCGNFFAPFLFTVPAVSIFFLVFANPCLSNLSEIK